MNPLNMLLGAMGNNNPNVNIARAIMQGGNPKQILMQYMNNVSPQTQNIFKLAEAGKTEELKDIARDMLKKEGRDFDTEFDKFTSQIK